METRNGSNLIVPIWVKVSGVLLVWIVLSAVVTKSVFDYYNSELQGKVNALKIVCGKPKEDKKQELTHE